MNPFIDGKPSEVTALAMGGFTPFLNEILRIQRGIHEAMTAHITALQTGDSLNALWWLLLVSFGYGVFHVLAPGHGKVIVASYFIGNRAKWIEGVWAGAIMAIGHTITAVAIVVALYFIFGFTQMGVLAKAQYMELIGYGLIALIGLWMLLRALKNPSGHACCGHDHGHEHHHHHHHDGKHGKKLFAVTSLVPCSGSMIILLFTVANNVLWAGILAVIAIALGMWITVTAIGIGTILLRHAMVGDEEHPAPSRRKLMQALGIGGAVLVMLTGGLLFTGVLLSLTG